MAIYNIIHDVVYKFIFSFKLTDYLMLFVFSFLVYVFQFYYKYFTRPNKLPGPLPLPFIECFYVFDNDNKKFYTRLQKKYGDICEFYLNNTRRIVISRPEYLEKILTPSTKDNSFLLRFPYTEALDEFGMAGKGIIANHNVKSWKYNRHFFNQAILTPSFNNEAVEWTSKLFQELEEHWKSLAISTSSRDNLQDDKNNWSLEIDIAKWARGFTSDMIVVLVTGERAYTMAYYHNVLSPVEVSRSGALIEDSERFIQGVSDHLMGLTIFMYIGSFLRHHMPFIKDKVKKLLDNRDYLFEKLDMIIKKRKKEIEGMPVGAELRHDMLTSLITANTERDINNTKNVSGDLLRPMTDDEIRGNIFDAFIGGVDTTANSFCVIIYYICRFPKVKQKMLAEIDSIIPPNTYTHLKHSDLLKLEYCEAIINEISRIMPLANEFPRHIDEPCEVAGYRWDAGVSFHVNVNGIHSHKDHWPNPEVFDPDRFYKNKNPRHKFSLITFGGGLRMCPGRKLAMIELLSLMVLMFGKYDFELVDMKAPLKFKSRIINVCEGLPIRIRPRN